MANRLQHLRGSETEHSTFTGEKGEISLVTDTSANRIPTGEVRVHDGTTAGGLHVTGAARAWVNFNGTFSDTSGQSGTYACSGSTITITDSAHGLSIGDSIHAAFTRSAGDTTTITDDFFVVLTVPSVDTFTIQTVVTTTDQSGTVSYDSDAATATAGSGPIRASYNVASITYNGTGDYTINFATAMPDNDYVVAACGRHQDGVSDSGVMVTVQTSNGEANVTAGSVKITTLNSVTSLLDSPFVSVAFFR